MDAVSCQTSLITSTHSHIQYYSSPLLTTKIYTEGYESSSYYKVRNKKLRNCYTVIFFVCGFLWFSILFAVGTTFIYIYAQTAKAHAETFNVNGMCQIIERKYDRGFYKYKWKANVSTFDVLCSDDFINKLFDDGPSNTDIKWNEGDQVICHTNNECDDICIKEKNDCYGAWRVNNGYYQVMFVCFYVSMAITGGCFCCMSYLILIHYLPGIPKQSKFDITGNKYHYYRKNENIREYYEYEWNNKLTQSQKFDYYMSYYSNKYSIDMTDNVYKIVYLYFITESDAMSRLDVSINGNGYQQLC